MDVEQKDRHGLARAGRGRTLAVLLGIGLGCGTTTARAVTVSATAWLDWSQFQVDFVSATGTLFEDSSDVYAEMPPSLARVLEEEREARGEGKFP